MGKLKIWGNDQNGYWELNRVCDPHEVNETVDRLVEGREGFEDHDYDPDGE
ncbi:hypothetical protein [Paenibacillus taichungensis]